MIYPLGKTCTITCASLFRLSDANQIDVSKFRENKNLSLVWDMMNCHCLNPKWPHTPKDMTRNKKKSVYRQLYPKDFNSTIASTQLHDLMNRFNNNIWHLKHTITEAQGISSFQYVRFKTRFYGQYVISIIIFFLNTRIYF